MAILASPIDSVMRVEHQMSNLWDLFIQDSSVGKYKYSGNIPRNFEINSVTLPFERLETIPVKGTNQRFYSGHNSDNMFSIEFYESQNFKIYDYFDKWFTNIYNRDKQCFNSFRSVQEYRSACERNFTLSFEKIIYNNIFSGMSIRNKTYYIYDVKILGIEDLSLDYVNGTPLMFKVNFTFNYLDSITI